MDKLKALQAQGAEDKDPRRRMSTSTMRRQQTRDDLDAKEEKVYRRWLNWKVQPVGGSVEESLETALADGVVLGHMLKVFCDVEFDVKRARTPIARLDQITTGLAAFKRANWPVSIESKVLAETGDGHRRAILGWIWQIINQDQLNVYGGGQPQGDEVREIYRWVDAYLADNYADVDRGDALRGLPAFQDGRLLSYLVHRTDPNAIDVRTLPEDWDTRTDAAIHLAADRLGVPPLVDHEDIIDAPDDRSLVTYLTAFRDTVEKRDRSIYDWVEEYLGDAYPDIPRGYPQKGIESFKDGRLLDYLVHKEHPDHMFLDAQRGKEPRQRMETAFEAARVALPMNPRIKPADVLDRNDERKLKQYLHDFRNALDGAKARELAAAEAEAERLQREREARAAQLAAEEAERQRRAAQLAADEAERQRRAAEAAAEEERRRREAAEAAAEAERRRREAEAAEAERRRREEEERRLRDEEDERRRREAIAIKSVRSIWPQRILIAELTEMRIVAEFDTRANARHTRMFGPGLEGATVGQPATFTVEARNAAGQPIRMGGHPFKLRVEGPRAGADPELQSVVDNHDGTYTATYLPTTPGVHTVRVTLEGENVAQSPVSVNCVPAARGDEDNLDDLRRLLEAIAREIARDKRNLSKLPEVTRKVEKLGLKDERAREVGRELREEDDPRLSDLLKVIDDIKNRAADALDDPKMAKSEIRKLVTPMLKNCVRDMNNWGDDYKDVMDKVNNLRPRGDGGKRQRTHIWVHRKGNPIPQHIMVTSNKPTEQQYRRHIRIDATKGFYDTHDNPASYLDGLLGVTGELKLQKTDSRDRYLTGGKDDDTLDEMDSNADEEPHIVNDKGVRVRPSVEPLLLEGALQSERGHTLYCFLYADAFITTEMVNNGERYVLKSQVKFDGESRVTAGFNDNNRAFVLRGRRGRERVLNAKSRAVAATWVSNIEAALRAVSE